LAEAQHRRHEAVAAIKAEFLALRNGEAPIISKPTYEQVERTRKALGVEAATRLVNRGWGLSTRLDAHESEWFEQRQFVETTRRKYQATIQHFGKWMEAQGLEPDWESITPDVAYAYIDHLAREGLDRPTIAAYKTAIRSRLQWLRRRRPPVFTTEVSDPWRDLELPKAKIKLKRRAFLPPELDLIFGYPLNPRLLNCLLVLLTGCRRGDAFRLRVSDVQGDHLIIRAGKTAANPRLLPTAQLAPFFAKLIAGRKPDEFLLVEGRGEHGRRGDYTTKRFTDLKRTLGLPAEVTIHSFRHLVFSNLTMVANREVARAICGHADNSTAGGYTHLDLQYLAEAQSKALDRLPASVKRHFL
jgi:integrase